MCPLISSGDGESVSSLGLDLAGLFERGVETPGKLFCEPACELGLYEAWGEPLDAVGERLPATSWHFFWVMASEVGDLLGRFW